MRWYRRPRRPHSPYGCQLPGCLGLENVIFWLRRSNRGVGPTGLYINLGNGKDGASRGAEEEVIDSASGIVSMFLSACGGQSQQGSPLGYLAD